MKRILIYLADRLSKSPEMFPFFFERCAQGMLCWCCSDCVYARRSLYNNQITTLSEGAFQGLSSITIMWAKMRLSIQTCLTGSCVCTCMGMIKCTMHIHARLIHSKMSKHFCYVHIWALCPPCWPLCRLLQSFPRYVMFEYYICTYASTTTA